MIKIYREAAEFNTFTCFNTDTGELNIISENDFIKLEQEKNTNGVLVYKGKSSPTHTRFPRRIYFQITRNCQLHCSYCYLKAGKNGSHLDKDVIFNLISYFKKQGLMEVRLTGGEPTTHPDFKEIYTKFKEHCIYVYVATNGLWCQNFIEFLSQQHNPWLIVSIDGSKETHNYFRRNSYDAWRSGC